MTITEFYCTNCRQYQKAKILKERDEGKDKPKFAIGECPTCRKPVFKLHEQNHETTNKKYLEQARIKYKNLDNNVKICNNCKHLIVPSKDFGSQIAGLFPWWHYKRGSGFLFFVSAQQKCEERNCNCNNPAI